MLREIVGLLALALAIAAALPFILTNEDGASLDPLPVATAVPTYTATAMPQAPTATSTPAADQGALPAPGAWTVTFYRDVSGARDDEDTVILDQIDMAFEGPPFGEYRDGSWGVVISGRWSDRPAGRYVFRLEYDCAITVTAGDRELVAAPDPPGPRNLDLELIHEGGSITVTLDAHDAPGPFLLRWK